MTFLIIRRRNQSTSYGNIILAGGFNAKTGTEKDYVSDHMDER